MSKRLCLILLAAGLAGPALAQNGTGFDPNRPCRSYVVQHLPVPTRCMAELLGNWSPKPYVDGEFMFRSYEEWLSWRDREDYKHWKARDYTWHAGLPASPPAAAIPAPAPTGPPAAALRCPPPLTLRTAAPTGWSGSETVLKLEPPPRVEAGTLICSYGRDRLPLSRPAWGRCVVRADATGFDCSP